MNLKIKSKRTRRESSVSSTYFFFKRDSYSYESCDVIESHLSLSFGNSADSVCGIGHINLGQGSGEVVHNNVANSEPSSLVTDANSTFSGCSKLQRSANSNSESCGSLMSFTSNNITQMGPYSVNMDPMNISHLQKKARVDIRPEDVMHLSQRQDLMQLEKLRQQQILQSMSSMQIAQLQQQQQLRNQFQQQSMQQMAAIKNLYDTGGVCGRRLMQYLYHLRQRPTENSIGYWRKFVAEYYAPGCKKRWCLSLYDSIGQHVSGLFPQVSMDGWHCDLCGSKSGKRIEATYEVLPRLNEIKFGSGVIDELLFVYLPRERRFGNGMMMLEFEKVVHKTVYEQLHVNREGKLRIIFSQDLKILSWDFCVRRHDELIRRRLVAPQVKQLLEVAQKCQTTLSDVGSDGVSSQDLQTNGDMIVTAAHRLAESLESQSLNELGFSKRYVRCLQIAEVVNSMKDLVDFCRDNKVGPIEGLKKYPRHNNTSRIPTGRTEIERDTVNPLASISGTSNHIALNGPSPLTNYQNTTRQNSPNSSANSLQQSTQSQSLPQRTIHQLLQEVTGGNTGGTPATPSASSNVLEGRGPTLSESNSFKAPSNSDCSAANQKTPDFHQNCLADDGVPDLPHDFSENRFFSSDLDDCLDFGWKD